MAALRGVLDATEPDPNHPDPAGAGRPRRPVHVIDPAAGGLRGLVDIPAVAGTGLLIGVGTAIGATYQASRAWWRATRARSR